MKYITQRTKNISIVTLSVVALFVIIFCYLTWNSNGNPYFMNSRWNAVITEPLAKMGNTDAQYKMGLYWFMGDREPAPTIDEMKKAIYWWTLAAENGSIDAVEMLAIANKELTKHLSDF